MGLTRTEHWATREFDAFLRQRAASPFAWGVNDCALFAADAIHAFTGTDIAADFRGKYTDEASAFALIRSVTGKGADPATAVADAAEYCATKAGLEEWDVALFAKRGDLVVVENDGRLIAGVVHLKGSYVVTVAEAGLVRLSILTIKRAWSTSCGSRPLRGETQGNSANV